MSKIKFMINQVSVIGAGTMGNGIAQVFIQCGYQVTLCDISTTALEKALITIHKNMDRLIEKGKMTSEKKAESLANLSTSSSMESACKNADLVVEAATENENIKISIFKEMDKYCPDHCILATNTSSISITKIAAQTSRPDKVIGMHFMNPVPIMKLVEIIRGYHSTNETYQKIYEACIRLEKSPVEVHDYPGFVANRILMPMINESIETLFQGVAGVNEIDTVMRLGMAHPMGPLQLADFIGLDVCLSILNVMYGGFKNPKYAPCPLLVNMVTAGKLGIKSGEGFYLYSAGSKEMVVAPYFSSK